MTKKSKVSGTSTRKNERVNATSINVACVNVAAPAGAGVTAGGADTAPVVLGGAAVAPAKVRQTGSDQLAASVVREDDLKLSALRARVVSRFAAPEWSGAAALRDSLLPLVESGTMSAEQFDAVMSAAARKAGVLTPICSVPRVLAVIRRYYLSDFESVTACKFSDVLAYYRQHVGGAFSFSVLLPLGSVRANSVQSDYIAAAAVGGGASASTIVSAVLSFRFLTAYRRALAAASSAARNELRESLANVWRRASQLGYTIDDVVTDLREVAAVVSDVDDRQRKQLERNNAFAWENINALNDAIIAAGGAESGTAKVRKLLAKRARFESVAATTARLLSLEGC